MVKVRQKVITELGYGMVRRVDYRSGQAAVYLEDSGQTITFDIDEIRRMKEIYYDDEYDNDCFGYVLNDGLY